MRARPAGPAQSSALHDFARSGPTKEAHRRAIYSSGGLLRSVAGRTYGARESLVSSLFATTSLASAHPAELPASDGRLEEQDEIGDGDLP
jgi:butyrate kinase